MSYKARLVYRLPSLQEGVTRIFDIPGRLKDDFVVTRVPNKKSERDVTASSDSIACGIKAIIRASDRVIQEMSVVGDKKRAIVRSKRPNSSSR
jgi:hypothetical protein